MNIFLQYIASPAVVAGVFLWFFYKFFELGKIKKTIEDAVDNIGELKKDSKSLLHNMTVVKTHLVTTAGVDANLFSAGSPLKLMKKGLELLKMTNFQDKYKKNKKWFIKEFKARNVSSLSDIDECSSKIVEKFYKNRDSDYLKEIAFQSGTTPQVLAKVLGIYLRSEVDDLPLK